MSIADELRKWFDRYTMRKDVYDELTAIADRIDAAHEEALSKAYMDMSDSEWVRLPKDADGVPIHLGDEVYQVEGGWVYTIESITLRPDNTTVTFSCKHGYGCDSSYNVRHYHAPTVEDVLHEFICDHEEGVRDEIDLIAEYAAKLRLAGSDAE